MSDMVHLDNGELAASIRLQGAELCSLRDCRSGEEFLWQNETGVWARTSPILFPVVGRVRDGGFLHLGKRYPMGIHGFASRSVFDSCLRNDCEASLLFSPKKTMLAEFPFDYDLQVDFRLRERTLQVQYTVRNHGSDPMYFSLGAHPAFALPSGLGGLADWSVVFDVPERDEVFRLAPGGTLLSSTPEPFRFAPGNAIVLSETLFERDALIFKNVRSGHVALVHRHSGQRLVVDTGGAPHLGLWAKPASHYLCIEPWWGVDDDATTPLALAEKPSMQYLLPGAARVFINAYGIGTA